MKLKPTFLYAFFKALQYLLLTIFLTIIEHYFNIRIVSIVVLVLAIISFIIFVYKLVYNLTISYMITEESLTFKRGLLNVKTDYIELYRIKDYSLEVPIHFRFLGIKRLILKTSDKTYPIFYLDGLKLESNFVPGLRDLVEKQRIKKRVYEID